MIVNFLNAGRGLRKAIYIDRMKSHGGFHTSNWTQIPLDQFRFIELENDFYLVEASIRSDQKFEIEQVAECVDLAIRNTGNDPTKLQKKYIGDYDD